jgi:hypothetical protein
MAPGRRSAGPEHEVEDVPMSISVRRLAVAMFALAAVAVVVAGALPAPVAQARATLPSFHPVLMSRQVLDEPPPSTDPVKPSCERACKVQADEFLKKCVDGGRPEEACREKAAAMAKDCIAKSCPPAATPTCETACAERGRVTYATCLRENGGDETVCKQKAERVVKDCLTKCPQPEAPKCEDRCQLSGKEAFDACLQRGNAPDTCEQLRVKTVRECIAKNCAPNVQPAPEPNKCEVACRERAEQKLKRCLASGTAPERCRNQVAELTRQCLIDNCPRVVPVPAPTTCKENCAKLAREMLERCKQGSTAPSPEACEQMAKALLERCVAVMCPQRTVEPKPAPQPEPAPCKQRCEMAGRDQYNACIANRGTPERCKLQAQESIEKCIKDNCPQPEPTPCKQRCENAGMEKYKACIDTGAAPERCKNQAQQFIEKCIQDNCPNTP